MTIFEEITEERKSQDQQWGGPSHDDQHEKWEWLEFLEKFLIRANNFAYVNDVQAKESYELNLIKAAALCVAAIEASRR